MLAALRARLTFANVVSLMALFVALSGGAYALTIPRNSVGPKQLKTGAVTKSKIKAGAVTSLKVQDNSLLARDFKAAQLPRGERGPAGQDATKLFAYIRDDGGVDTATVQYGRGVTAVSDPAGDESYIVTFNRSLTNCVAQVTQGVGSPPGSATSALGLDPQLVLDFPSAGMVRVTFVNDVGMKSDTAFMITAFC